MRSYPHKKNQNTANYKKDPINIFSMFDILIVPFDCDAC